MTTHAAAGFRRRRPAADFSEDGKVRYNATYVDLRGSIRSAGTFATEKAANRAWQQAEAELRQGRVGDPARGRQTLRKYVEERWLPNQVLPQSSSTCSTRRCPMPTPSSWSRRRSRAERAGVS